MPGGRVEPQALADFEAAELRHHHIEQHEVRLPIAHCAQGGFAVGHSADLVIGVAEVGFQQFSAVRVVLGHEDTRGGVGCHGGIISDGGSGL